jgi:glycosyltransferase involved in cell wall biosynthesis
MKLSEKLTIIIPSKNEQHYIGHLLEHLAQQQVGDTRIIIADCSTDNTRAVIRAHSQNLCVELVAGGPVAAARNSAARLVTTPYLLFLDADVRFFNPNIIHQAVEQLENHNLDLVGLNVRCYDNNWLAQCAFSLFNVINNILKYKTPFAVGAFMLTRRSCFEQLGGFPECYATSEDFFLSRQYSASRFKILADYFGQDSRRFKKLGYFNMAKYLLLNFINQNNAGYWQKLDHTKYWQ